MKLEKIEELYPKAFQIFYKWWQNIPSYKDRDLYDFFDGQGIVLCVHRTQDEYFTWYIDRSELEHRRPRTTTRIEAEEAGFEKCFSILEKQLEIT